jgi:hypothetical protein
MPRRYNEYSREELLTLNQEQVQKLIDLECAYEGILPAERPIPPEKFNVKLEPTIQVYEVAGVLFEDINDANKVISMRILHEKYDYLGAGYDYKWAEPRELSVTPKKLYKREDIQAAAVELTRYKELKARYDNEQKEYLTFVESTQKYREKVMTAVNAAIDFFYNKEKVNTDFAKFIKLAENDTNIALNFLNSAYKDYLEEEYYLEAVGELVVHPDVAKG